VAAGGLAAAMAAVLGAGLAAPAPALAAGTPVCVSAEHPLLAGRMSDAIAAALAHRRPDVGLAVADPGLDLSCALRQGSHFDAASVIKVTIISALLLKAGGTAHLTSAQRSLAWSMITQSSNSAATALWNETGMAAMQRFLNRAGMTHTQLSPAWGLTLITAQDEVRLLGLLTSPGTVLDTASRDYVLYLMAHVTGSQRWGTPAGVPAGVTVHVKNGWLPYPTGSDWHVNSIGAFAGPGTSYQMAVLTAGNPSMAYGVGTIEAAARVVNLDIASFIRSRPAGAGATIPG
jgi:Beta-lactamase enzyme family